MLTIRRNHALIEAKAQADQEAASKSSAAKYLAETDWYVTRFAETGTPIPAGVSTARAEARKALSAA